MASTVRNLNPRLISNKLLRVDANRVGMGIGPNENYSADRQTTDFPLARTVKRVANASQHEVAANHAVVASALAQAGPRNARVHAVSHAPRAGTRHHSTRR